MFIKILIRILIESCFLKKKTGKKVHLMKCRYTERYTNKINYNPVIKINKVSLYQYVYKDR